MSRAEVYICDECGAETRVEGWLSRPDGWSQIDKGDMCPACTASFQEWRAARAAPTPETKEPERDYEERWCPDCQKHKETLVNECVECGADT